MAKRVKQAPWFWYLVGATTQSLLILIIHVVRK